MIGGAFLLGVLLVLPTGGAAAASRADQTGEALRGAELTDAAIVLTSARSVIVVPGYGMAAARCQHTLRESARTVIVLTRGKSPGFANIDNEFFARPNTMMLFGDANKSLIELVRVVKEIG